MTYGSPRLRRDFTGSYPIVSAQWLVPISELESDLLFLHNNSNSGFEVELVIDDCDPQLHTVKLSQDTLSVKDHIGTDVTLSADLIVTPNASDVELDSELVMLFNEYLDEPEVLGILKTLGLVVNDALMVDL